MSVIKQCSCEASCHRFSYLEAFLERNDSNHPAVQEKVPTQLMWCTYVSLLLQIVDVGRCVGRCNTVIPGRCLSRE